MPDTSKKVRGRPPTGVKFPDRLQVCVDKAFLETVDARRQETDKPGRTEAIRRLAGFEYTRGLIGAYGGQGRPNDEYRLRPCIGAVRD
jgi:hypothetical protein